MLTQESFIARSTKEVLDALQEIGLTREIVVEVARSAAAARAEALSVDPLSAPGLLSYIYGIRVIRLHLLKAGWRISRVGNVESTVNDELGIQLCFQNVDTACDAARIPHAISGKGSASRKLVAAGQGDLFEQPNLTSGSKVGSTPTVWVVCVSADDESIRTEVSCPTSFEGAQFEDFHRRIFVLDESFDHVLTEAVPEANDLDYLDVTISKK